MTAGVWDSVVCTAVLALLFCAGAVLQAQTPVSSPALTEEQAAELAASMASGKPPAGCVAAMKSAVMTARATGKTDDLQALLSFDKGQICPTWLLLSSDQFRAAVAEARRQAINGLPSVLEQLAVKELKAISQQNGASVGTGGGTSLTSKGLAAKILAIANEYGALTQTTSADTTTVSGSFAGVPTVLLNRGLLVDCEAKIFALTPCGKHQVFDYMQRVSYTVSFDTSAVDSTTVATPVGSVSNGAQAVSASSTNHSVSAFGFKWVAWQLPPEKDAVSAAQQKVMQSAQAAAFARAVKMMQIAENAPTFLPWYVAKGQQLLKDAQADATGETAVTDWESMGTGFAVALGIEADVTPGKAVGNPTLLEAANLAQAVTAYLGAQESTGALIPRPPVLSFEYDANRPASAPSNSTFRVIAQGKAKSVTFTANGAFSIYNEAQTNVPGAGRLRDVQFAAEASKEFKMGLLGTTPQIFTASGAFYDQYQSSPAILNVTPGAPVDGVTFIGLPSTATQVYGTTGNIAVAQFKLTTGAGSSVTVPLSVTYSNRTELITKPTWRAQIGISYDFDSLFGGSK